MALCEMEPFLSVTERPEIKLPEASSRHPYDQQLRFRWAFDEAKPDVINRNVIPERKAHPNLKDAVVELTRLALASSSRTPKEMSSSSTRISRIHSEVRSFVKGCHPYYDFYVSECNMRFWKVVMQGPPDGAYEAGAFLLYLHMEDNYPTFAPKGRFVTPIYHPNVNRHGRICHSIFDRNWTTDTTMRQVIDTVWSLLLVPEFSDQM